MATTASVQDIDSFIRLQKEKLNREKNLNSFQPPLLQNVELDYNKRLDNYLALPRTFENFEPAYPLENQNPLIKQPPASAFMPNPPLKDFSPERNSNNRQQFKENDDPQNGDGFFGKFGTYDAKKNQLKNDLHQEYNQYLQKKNSNNSKSNKNNTNRAQANDEFFATLPLKGMDSAKEKAKKQRNYEYQLLQNKLENSDKGRKLDWWKDRNSPVVKPYSVSRHDPMKETNQDVISERRLQHNNQFDNSASYARQQIPESNSYENMRQMPMDAWRTPVPPPAPMPVQQMPQMMSMMPPVAAPLMDASLADILRRPPVGYKPQMQFPPSYNMNPMSNMYEMNDPYRYQQSQSPTYQSQPMTMSNQMSNYSQPASQPQSFQQNFSKGNTTQRNKSDSFPFSDEPPKDAKAQKAKEYQEELQRQVREKQIQKQREKEEQARLDQKIIMESSNYNPYGRSGGGAPIRDRSGNVVANLAQIRADPEKYSPRPDMPPPPQPPANNKNFSPDYHQPNVQQFSFGNQFQSASNENLMQQFGFNTTSQTSREDGQSFARGGNGIFGEGKSDEQKRQQERYQAELQKQIEEKKRAKEEEKERQRIEDEKEMKRIKEQQERIKAELEEEERKKKAKEEQGRRVADDAKRLAEEQRKKQEQNKKSNQVKQAARKFQRHNNNANADTNSIQESQAELNEAALPPQPPVPGPPAQSQFRSDSPPVPAQAKKLDKTKQGGPANKPKPTAYYVTESRLNLNMASPTNNENPSNPIANERSNSGTDFLTNGNRISDPLGGEFPTKPVLRKQMNRSPSIASNNEMITQLKSLKKHLHKEQMQIENQLNNANNRTTIGQMSDIRQSILNVKTPPGDHDPFQLALKEPLSGRLDANNNDFQRTYRKYLDTPPLQGGLEPRTYYRDNTVLLDNQKNDIFHNDLQKQARERQLNRMNQLNLPLENAEEQLTARNQQRLKKLRNIEDDSLSNADPNEVLEKFLNRNNRQPSAATLNDDTWLRNPA